MAKEMSQEAVASRVKKMLDLRAGVDVTKEHVRIMKGNKKTGADCYTVSLIPVADCQNCKMCKNQCYDVRNDCIYNGVLSTRAINSAIHKADPTRYWNEVRDFILNKKGKKITHMRINVGGDLNLRDFQELHRIAQEIPDTTLLFFTKNYDDFNKYLAENEKPDNIRVIFSRWKGAACDNPNRIPESHVIYEDGSSTCEGEYFECPGNCTDCFHNGVGCWTLKQGESVGFHVH